MSKEEKRAKALIEAIDILSKYKGFDFHGELDCISSKVQALLVTADDRVKLEDLGWYVDDWDDCWNINA